MKTVAIPTKNEIINYVLLSDTSVWLDFVRTSPYLIRFW